MEVVLLLVPAVFGAVIGALTFFVTKKIVRSPGSGVRFLSGLVAGGMTVGLALMGANALESRPDSVGDGNVMIAALMRIVFSALAGLPAFVFGLGVGQKPKSDWIG